MDIRSMIGCAIGVVGSVLLLIAAFSRKYRRAPMWLRWLFFSASPAAFGWGSTGMFLAWHQHGAQTDLNQRVYWVLDHMHSNLAGLALGLLIALTLTPGFWQRSLRGTVSV